MTNADAADIAQHDPTHAEITLVLLRQKRAKLGLMASDVPNHAASDGEEYERALCFLTQ
jgi:hypothetical protein